MRPNCPKCNSKNFIQGVHVEECPDCGYAWAYDDRAKYNDENWHDVPSWGDMNALEDE